MDVLIFLFEFFEVEVDLFGDFIGLVVF